MKLLKFLNQPKEGNFIQKPVYDPNVFFTTNLYELAYFPPISADKMTKTLETGNTKAIYAVISKSLNMVAYQLYAIPAVRKYFGDEFVHGFSTRPENDGVYFDNLDETDQAIQYTKEITKVAEVIFANYLEANDYYIFYQDNHISFLPAASLKQMKHMRISGRIVWQDR